jgi:hypothetical protein
MCETGAVAVRKTPIALALALQQAWKKLPPKQRRQVLEAARKHGPTVAGKAAVAGRTLARKARRSGG